MLIMRLVLVLFTGWHHVAIALYRDTFGCPWCCPGMAVPHRCYFYYMGQSVGPHWTARSHRMIENRRRRSAPRCCRVWCNSVALCSERQWAHCRHYGGCSKNPPHHNSSRVAASSSPSHDVAVHQQRSEVQRAGRSITCHNSLESSSPCVECVSENTHLTFSPASTCAECAALCDELARALESPSSWLDSRDSFISVARTWACYRWCCKLRVC